MANQSIQFEEYFSQEDGTYFIDFGFPMAVEVQNFPYTFGISCAEMQWECEKRGWEDVEDMPYNDLYEKLQIVVSEKINVGSSLEVNRIVKMNRDLQEMVVDLTHERNDALLTIENLNDEISRLRFEVDKLNAELLTTGKRFMYAHK